MPSLNCWPRWNAAYSPAITTGTTSATPNQVIWYEWLGQCRATTGTITVSNASATWEGWNGQYVVYGVNGEHIRIQTGQAPQQLTLTPEQMAAVERQRVDHAAQMAQRQQERALLEAEAAKRRDAASARAKRLLKEVLTSEQWEQYLADGSFMVRSQSGAIYRLRHGWAGNVQLLDDTGRATDSFCIHPRENVPYEDNLIAQMMMLTSQESEFLRVANRTRLN
jgi:hypothetical protein